MNGVVPFLWFDSRAEEAATFYTKLIPNSRILHVARGPSADGAPAPTILVAFELDGREYMALNGGPTYRLTPAFSLFVRCADQAEVDHYWSKLLEGGGEESMCGWLLDRFGVSWQVIPDALGRLMSDPDPARAGRVQQAMLQMRKIDVAALEQAHAGA